MKEFLQQYIFIYIGIISLVTFALFGMDKKKAQKHKWRISEKTLLGSCIIGGFLGGLMGMKFFHHKTKHYYFYVINIISMILWTAGLFLLLK